VNVAIEADEPGILQIGGRDLVEREFPTSPQRAIKGIRAERPSQDLRHGCLHRGTARQRYMLFGVPKILRCRRRWSAAADVTPATTPSPTRSHAAKKQNGSEC